MAAFNSFSKHEASIEDRLAWVDTAKGVSIILVVLMYSAYNTGKYTGQVGFLHYVIGFATPFRMPEFFVISGLFLSCVIGRQWRVYADRRVVHYFYFYALWASILVISKIGLFGGRPSEMLVELGRAVIEPYGVLWFIYLLGVFGLATKVLWQLRVPPYAILLTAAALNLAEIDSSAYVVQQFCAYFVFYYLGFVGAPTLFRIVRSAQERPALATAGLFAWSLVNGALVYSPGYAVLPTETQMGWAALPLLHIMLAVMGTASLCVLAALLSNFRWMAWLTWLGRHSLVVYVAFTIPMSLFRSFALSSGVIVQTGTLSMGVLVVSVGSPLVLYALVKVFGRGRFLFERPAWARLAPSMVRAVV